MANTKAGNYKYIGTRELYLGKILIDKETWWSLIIQIAEEGYEAVVISPIRIRYKTWEDFDEEWEIIK